MTLPVLNPWNIFQLTASQGGWLKIVILSILITYFNSQPHKEADLEEFLNIRSITISTHSLTRRLTNCTVTNDRLHIISTHSLTRRLTSADKSVRWYTLHFNSQPHKEADVTVYGFSPSQTISTHSLTRRLTFFQGWQEKGICHFNSQPHKEADTLSSNINVCWCISTHSLTRRLTAWYHRLLWHTPFQLTASQGGWLLTFCCSPFCLSFQLTASQGGWRCIYSQCSNDTIFQLTASQGGWQQFYSIKIASFNSFL